MKKNVLIYGLIMGVLFCANMIYTVNLCYSNPEYESNDLLGYTLMVVVNALTFVGILNYRNKELGGYISFGKAFKVGAFMVLLASAMYVIVWLFYFYNFVPDWMDAYTKHVLVQAQRDGATAAELAQQTEQMEQFKELYKSPVMVVLITFAEILPVGLIVALISALILRKKQ